MNARFLAVTLAISAASGFAVTFGAPAAKAPAPPPPAAPALATPGAAAPVTPLSKEQSDFFEAKVRPVLAASCYKCHSIEQGKSKGSLTLDTKDATLKGGDTGPAIVPGDAAKSLLIKAISYADQDLQMPPKGEKLSPQAVADLTQWVKMGAPDPRTGAGAAKLTGLTDRAKAHWAYQPIKPTTVPTVKPPTPGYIKTPVDAFILAKLEQAGMKPSAQASRETLIRRVSYDLIGLPPTPDETRAFVNDKSPNAYEKLIDRLLASPHYGERWGRFWLDTARYSDTTGSDSKKDDYRYAYAWTYRDYVIKSFNDDKPYDRFLTEQIAADLLPGVDKAPDTLAALGFLTVGKRFVNKNDTIDERIDTLSKATMAMTVACSRCHDHKFDPIPTADYYSLHGIFSSIMEPDEKPVVAAVSDTKLLADYKAKEKAIEQKNRDIYYKVIDETSAEFCGKAAGYILSSHYSKGQFRDPLAKQKAVKEFELSSKGNGQLLNATPVDKKDDPVFAPFRWFAAASPSDYGEVLQRIASGNGKKGSVNPRVIAAFKDVSPSSLKDLQDVAKVYGKLFASIRSQAKTYIEAVKKGETPTVDASLAQLFDAPIKIEPASVLTMDHLRDVAFKMHLGEGAYNTFAFSELNELELTHPAAPGRAMVVADLQTATNSPIFIRGEATNKGRVVPRQFLEILSGPSRKPFSAGSGRLELAKAIASKDNPLTARVLVNRVWLHHFGEGFVRTPDDLGVQSEAPSHPELLDYLATQFVEEGWSLKKLHKTILLSSTYQQVCDTVPTYQQKDPDNRMLWRSNLRRLDFEAIRDTMLQFSGKLDRTLGGKPVNITDEPYTYRRSVYGYVDRGNLPELLAEFDYSDPNRPNSKRTTTIVPQQALFFMNSPMAADVARKACSRSEFLKATDDYARVRALYEVIYQRQPKATEVALVRDFYNAHILRDPGKPRNPVAAAKAEAAAKAAAAKAEASAVTKKPAGAKGAIQNEGEAVERTPLTIWEQYAQALLFANEIAYVN